MKNNKNIKIMLKNAGIILGILLICFVIFTVYIQIKETYLQDEPVINELRKTITPFFDNTDFKGVLSELNDRQILKKIKIMKGEKSYTINKKKIYLCLRDEKGKYYNKNMLLYVLLHEISHTICKSIGHTDEFHTIFEELLLEATKQKMYNPKIPLISNYCEHGDSGVLKSNENY